MMAKDTLQEMISNHSSSLWSFWLSDDGLSALLSADLGESNGRVNERGDYEAGCERPST